MSVDTSLANLAKWLGLTLNDLTNLWQTQNDSSIYEDLVSFLGNAKDQVSQLSKWEPGQLSKSRVTATLIIRTILTNRRTAYKRESEHSSTELSFKISEDTNFVFPLVPKKITEFFTDITSINKTTTLALTTANHIWNTLQGWDSLILYFKKTCGRLISSYNPKGSALTKDLAKYK